MTRAVFLATEKNSQRSSAKNQATKKYGNLVNLLLVVTFKAILFLCVFQVDDCVPFIIGWFFFVDVYNTRKWILTVLNWRFQTTNIYDQVALSVFNGRHSSNGLHYSAVMRWKTTLSRPLYDSQVIGETCTRRRIHNVNTKYQSSGQNVKKKNELHNFTHQKCERKKYTGGFFFIAECGELIKVIYIL